MSEIMQILEAAFKPLVFVFSVSNLFYMGLQVKKPEVIAALKNKKTLALILVWGWVVGPALAYLIVWILPLAEPFVIGLLLYSLAPVAPFLPVMVGKARGDVSFAGALIPIVAVATVVFMPLMAPLMIEGLTVSSWDLVKVLLIYILFPLALGAAIRHYAESVATKILPAAGVIAKISTVLISTDFAVLHFQKMIATAGSFALLSMTIHIVVIGWITYRFGFGLKQNQRSVMSLGMLTRNGSVVLIAAVAIPDVDPVLITYIIMYILWSVVLSFIAAIIFGKQAGKTVEGDTA
jgi:bile acid:Na+ symporter, BASS family